MQNQRKVPNGRIHRGQAVVLAMVAILPFAVAAAAQSLPGPGHLRILQAQTDASTHTLFIEGEFFLGPNDSQPAVTLSRDPLVVLHATDTRIEAALPDRQPGTYLLQVSRGAGTPQNDTFALTIGAVGPPGPQGPRGEPGADLTTTVAALTARVVALEALLGFCPDASGEPGAPCSVGFGSCERFGFEVCSEDGASTKCNATPGSPSVEVCDGLDNDCDGQVDEGFAVGTPCSAGVGLCQRFGVTVCSTDGSSSECNAQPGTPAEEQCDGFDNDCDGLIDEGCPAG